MKVLLYEQWHGGHYNNYLNALVPELARLSTTLVIAVNGKMRQSPAARETWSRYPNVEFASTLTDVMPELDVIDRYAAARNLMSCLHETRPDYTIVPSADAQSTGMAVLNTLGMASAKRVGPIEATLHFGYGYSAASRKDRFKELVYSGTYRRVPYTSVNFVHFSYHEYVITKGLIGSDRAHFVGDPVPQPARIGQAAARRLLGLESGGRYLGLLGSLDRRKAIPELLAAFRAARLAVNDRLLLAGRLDPAFSTLIHEQYGDLVRSGQIVVLDRYLSDAELENGYEALDLATVVYYNFPGLASLALKAVAAGTPVIAHDFGWLRAAIRRFDIGRTSNIFDTTTFAADLRLALDRDRCEHPSEAVRRLLAFHTEENFVAQMTRGLREASGQQPTVKVEWESVLEALPAERRFLL